MEKAAVLFNPSSGKGRSIKRKTEIEGHFKRLGVGYDLFISKSESHLTELTAEKAGQYPVIVAVGGDTTLNIAAREILKREKGKIPKLGMVGTGSANDIVRALGIHKIEDACRAVKNGNTVKMDVGRLVMTNESGTHALTFLGTVSAGMGTTVNRYVEDFLTRHTVLRKIPPLNQLAPGLMGMFRSFSTGKLPLHARVKYRESGSGEVRELAVDFSLLVMLNTPFYANGMKLGPDNGLTDGLLDGCIVSTNSFLKTVWVGLKSGSKNFHKRPEVKKFQSSEVEIIPGTPMEILVDGDIYSNVQEFTVSLLENRLNVLAP